MKNFCKLFGAIALVAVFLSCEGPAGYSGSDGSVGQQGPAGTPGSGALTMIDAQGRTIGTVVDGGSIVTNGNFTFSVHLTEAFITREQIFATEFITGIGVAGEFYTIVASTWHYPNFIFGNWDQLFRPKHRDADGFPTDLQPRTSRASRGASTYTWTIPANPTLHANSVEIELATLTVEEIIGFVPARPVSFVVR